MRLAGALTLAAIVGCSAPPAGGVATDADPTDPNQGTGNFIPWDTLTHAELSAAP